MVNLPIKPRLSMKILPIKPTLWPTDHNNTEHYHYSGLLYLSTYNTDFTGYICIMNTICI
jgi:hypothetical protein